MIRNTYSVPNADIGKQKVISGTTTANALVALKNPGGSYVAFAEADADGYYSFTVDNNIPLQVEVAAASDPTATTTQVAINGTRGNVVYVDVSMISNAGPYWAGAPSLSFVDRTGSGAAASASLASVGQTYKYYGSSAVLDELYGGVGAPVRHVVITSVGENYSGPSNNSTVNPPFYGMRVVGNTVQQAFNVDPNNPPPGAFEHNNNWFVLVPQDYIIISALFNSPNHIRDVMSKNWWVGKYSSLAQATGAGQPTNYGASWITGSLPTATNLTPPAGDAGSGQNLINLVKAGFDGISEGPYYKGYRAIIYGQNPNDINDIGLPAGLTGAIVKPDGAVDAYSRGIISLQELDVLKGYFGKEMLVGGILTTSNQLTKQIVSTVLLFAWNIMQGASVTRISTEMLSVARQGKGVEITDMQERVKPILDKMQNGTGNYYINNLQVKDANNVIHQWNFAGSAPTKTVP